MQINFKIPSIGWGWIACAALIMCFWWRECHSPNEAAEYKSKLKSSAKSFDSLQHKNKTDSSLSAARLSRWQEIGDSIMAELAGAKYEEIVAKEDLKIQTNKAQRLAALVQSQGGKVDTTCLELSQEVDNLNKQIMFSSAITLNMQNEYEQALSVKDSVITETKKSKQQAIAYGQGVAILYSDLLAESKRMQPRNAVYAGFVAQGNEVTFIQAAGLGLSLVTKAGKLYGANIMMHNGGGLLYQAEAKFKINFRNRK